MKTKPVNRMETKFISTISHKLRTPLNSIMGFSELLLDQAYGELNEKQIHYLKNINTSGKNLLSLLNDLIDLINVKWGKIDLQYTNFSLNQSIDFALQTIRPFADKKNISLEIRNDNHLKTIRADEIKFEKILHYLFSNAIKFTPPKGRVEITTKYLESPPPHFLSPDSHHFVEISVADTGIGIKPENQEKIFSELYQVDSIQSQEFEGSGLGLSLARGLVRLHHGKIWVESDEGKGSKFVFILPLSEK